MSDEDNAPRVPLPENVPADERTPAPTCKHCGYTHFRPSGKLKYTTLALQCPVYIKLVIEEVWEDLSASARKPLSPSKTIIPDCRRPVCGAPDGFTCFWRGTKYPNGKPQCMSPDGFPSEVQEGSKLIMISREISHSEGMELGLPPGDHVMSWDRNDALLCEHQKRAPRIDKSKFKPEEERQRSKSAKNNGMRVRSEQQLSSSQQKKVVRTIETRIIMLRSQGQPITAKKIAAMGTFVKQVKGDGNEGDSLQSVQRKTER